MGRCFVNTDELFLGHLVLLYFPAALLSAQLPTHPLTTHLFPALLLPYESSPAPRLQLPLTPRLQLPLTPWMLPLDNGTSLPFPRAWLEGPGLWPEGGAGVWKI